MEEMDGEARAAPLQFRAEMLASVRRNMWDFYKIFLFQSLRVLGSTTSQRPEQSADQVHEGAGGEGGGWGGAEEQWGGQQQQPRPRAGPVQAAGGEVDIKDCEEKFTPSPIASSFVDLSYQVLNYSCVKKIYTLQLDISISRSASNC